MPTRNNKPRKNQLTADPSPHNPNCYEGEQLASLLQSIQREIKAARVLDGSSLPHKIWLKQQFSIGVNDVTRVLERMIPTVNTTKLQAVVIASDCQPKWLTKHLPGLALSRNVPVISLKDKGAASLRLGQLFNLKTAIAIGVKAKGSVINKLFEEIVRGNHLVTDSITSSEEKLAV